jgi:hypothetical protein
MPRQLVREAVRSGRVTPIDSMAPLSEGQIDEASHLVGQMGTEAFCRALQTEADEVIADRACDTAIFAAVPALLGCPMGPAVHMAKIIECASLRCVPGGRPDPRNHRGRQLRARKHGSATARNGDVGRRAQPLRAERCRPGR